MGLKDTCNWTKHNFCCFCSQCDPWKVRFTYSNIFSAQTDLNIYKQPALVQNKMMVSIFLPIFVQFLESIQRCGKAMSWSASNWRPFDKPILPKRRRPRPRFSTYFTESDPIFFSRLLSGSISKITFTKKENENFNIFHRIGSFDDFVFILICSALIIYFSTVKTS